MSATSTYAYQRGLPWLKRWLSGRPHQVIGGEHGDPYMLRWYVIPRNPLLNVYVHKFLRSDDDRALHDHPWGFASLILRGGYAELTEQGLVLRRPGTVAFRLAEHRHRVILHAVVDDRGLAGLRPCWTLIVTGPRRRMWGFWCKRPVPHAVDHFARSFGAQVVMPERFVPWEQFGDGGCGETS